MIYSLYQYTNRVNGKKYIGVTNNLARRQKEHAHVRGNAYAFHNAVSKYGIDTFDFKVLAIFDRVDAAAYHELAAIIKFGTMSPAGYNLRAGAPGTKYAGPMSPETKLLMSQAQTGKHRGPQSLAHKKARSKALTGRHLSLEHRSNLSKACMGRKVSRQARQAISKSLTGRKRIFSAAHCRALSLALKGRTCPEERKKKVSKTMLGKPFSAKHLRALRKGIKVYWATQRQETKNA